MHFTTERTPSEMKITSKKKKGNERGKKKEKKK